MKKLMPLVLLLAAVSSYAEPGQCGRYQIELAAGELFMIDSQTGRIWQMIHFSGDHKTKDFWFEMPVHKEGNKRMEQFITKINQDEEKRLEAEKNGDK